MIDWDSLEKEYNKNYDPYSSSCPQCGAEDMDVEHKDQTYCFKCGYVYRDES